MAFATKPQSSGSGNIEWEVVDTFPCVAVISGVHDIGKQKDTYNPEKPPRQTAIITIEPEKIIFDGQQIVGQEALYDDGGHPVVAHQFIKIEVSEDPKWFSKTGIYRFLKLLFPGKSTEEIAKWYYGPEASKDALVGLNVVVDVTHKRSLNPPENKTPFEKFTFSANPSRPDSALKHIDAMFGPDQEYDFVTRAIGRQV